MRDEDAVKIIIILSLIVFGFLFITRTIFEWYPEENVIDTEYWLDTRG